MLPTAVRLRKVVMADKWQQINLKLDAELAQVLREMKQGHDESLAEVVIRLLKRVVRQHVGTREATGGRSIPKGRTGRGAVGAARKGKPAPAGRAGSRTSAPGKPWTAPPAAAEWPAAEGGRGRRAPARAPAAAEWPAAEGGRGRRAPARAPAAAAWPAEGGDSRAPARASAPARGPRRVASKASRRK